jgi:hypothetical protein
MYYDGYYSLAFITFIPILIIVGIVALIVPGEKISYNDLLKIYRETTGLNNNKHLMFFIRRNKPIYQQIWKITFFITVIASILLVISIKSGLIYL